MYKYFNQCPLELDYRTGGLNPFAAAEKNNLHG